MNPLEKMLPHDLFWTLKKLKMKLLGGVIGIVNRVGLNVVKTNNYYSAMPVKHHIKKTRSRWDRPSPMKGIAYDFDKSYNWFEKIHDSYGNEWKKFEPYRKLQKIGFGPGYSQGDSLSNYAVLRDLKPKRYIEIGSGLSTYYSSKAGEENAKEGFPMQIICIEPYPFDKLYSIPNIQIEKKQVQDIPIDFFKQLENGDVLFIDCSHIVQTDSDCTYLYLEVLPNLNQGVFIHIHDMHFPYNTPYPADQWIFERDWPMYWNEAMLVQAFLAYNDHFSIELSLPMVRYQNKSKLESLLKNYPDLNELISSFSSLWLKRIR